MRYDVDLVERLLLAGIRPTVAHHAFFLHVDGGSVTRRRVFLRETGGRAARRAPGALRREVGRAPATLERHLRP
ncbi:MAG: hypothetical protein E6J81_05185 [Deltaproteobacteria bacterium]|nr:MAG: hypothetical protein E6J81_05185 [Deltaproteobacteria bacterium]TMA87956.1 MAG: hypothetical protein E6J77_09390 [Deltaproteobacteria bacterium]